MENFSAKTINRPRIAAAASMSGSSYLSEARLDSQNEPDGPVNVRTVSEERAWQALRYFCLYRIVISGLFSVLALLGKLPSNFSNFDLRDFTVTACAYLGLAIAAQIGV